MLKIAIATCAEKRDLAAGDRLLAEELRALGAAVSPLVWTETPLARGEWDVVVIRSVWDYHLKVRAFTDWLAKVEASGARSVNPARVVRWNIDKAYLLELERAGVRIVPTSIGARDEATAPAGKSVAAALRSEALARGWSRVVVKPTVSATSHLTVSCEAADELGFTAAVVAVLSHADAMVQPFLPSVTSDGEVSLIFFQEYGQVMFSHAVLKTARAGDFRVQGDFGGNRECFEASAALREIGASILKSVTDDWVFARVDLVDWKTEPLLSELEMIEPELFLDVGAEAGAPRRLARAIFSAF